MYTEIFVKYVHFLCIFLIVGAIIGQHLLLKKEMLRGEIRRIAILDNIYGISTILLLAAGFTLWFGVGKPAEYYSKNWIFHLKIGLFIVVGFLSIYPTLYFRKNKKGDPDELVVLPSTIKHLIRLELLLIFLMPLLATFMAKGFGAF